MLLLPEAPEEKDEGHMPPFSQLLPKRTCGYSHLSYAPQGREELHTRKKGRLSWIPSLRHCSSTEEDVGKVPDAGKGCREQREGAASFAPVAPWTPCASPKRALGAWQPPHLASANNMLGLNKCHASVCSQWRGRSVPGDHSSQSRTSTDAPLCQCLEHRARAMPVCLKWVVRVAARCTPAPSQLLAGAWAGAITIPCPKDTATLHAESGTGQVHLLSA